eukprot:5991380-Pleurochrysis_carterae.AAC.2
MPAIATRHALPSLQTNAVILPADPARVQKLVAVERPAVKFDNVLSHVRLNSLIQVQILWGSGGVRMNKGPHIVSVVLLSVSRQLLQSRSQLLVEEGAAHVCKIVEMRKAECWRADVGKRGRSSAMGEPNAELECTKRSRGAKPPNSPMLTRSASGAFTSPHSLGRA